MRSLVGKPINYYSCFISYSSKDDAFARRLYADLQSHNVRCWFAPEDLKWGERIRTGIDKAIRLHDKLLLILSKSSVASGWVEREVKTALQKSAKKKDLSSSLFVSIGLYLKVPLIGQPRYVMSATLETSPTGKIMMRTRRHLTDCSVILSQKPKVAFKTLCVLVNISFKLLAFIAIQAVSEYN